MTENAPEEAPQDGETREAAAVSAGGEGIDETAAADRPDEGATAAEDAGQTTSASPEPSLVPDSVLADQRYLRLAADFENFRRRKAQELSDRSRYASEEAARAMLPVLDNLRRAVDHAGSADPADLLDGLHMVVREFEAALSSVGVTPIDSVGTPFDPAVHEALGGEEADGVAVDTVSEELQRGYRLHDRVLRPALVRVAHPRGH
ncbi:MAG: nucleotide exchange factor GrpE [Candidatus Dormibacteria bacterium]